VSEKEFEEVWKDFFDLERDYSLAQSQILSASGESRDHLELCIKKGSGIRILNQDPWETTLSFVISQNNNIKRITNSVFYLREKFGEKLGDFYAFPTLEKLSCLTEEDFRNAGTGYRSTQLVKLISQLSSKEFLTWGKLSTETLKTKLIALSGVGPKVADCIMLFGYGKSDVFPVDTWIDKAMRALYPDKCTNLKTTRLLGREIFGENCGMIQQYLFFYARENKIF
jgi:N-glycosylase/DNA lyase